MRSLMPLAMTIGLLAVAACTATPSGSGVPAFNLPEATESEPVIDPTTLGRTPAPRPSLKPPAAVVSKAPTASPSRSPSPSPTSRVGFPTVTEPPESTPTPDPTPTPTPTATATATPTPTPTPTATPTPTPTPTTVAVQFGADVVPILENNCAACHTTGGAGAAQLTMFNSGGAVDYTAVSGAIDTILSKVTTNQMPMGGPPLSDAEKATLRAWMEDGAQNN